MKLVAFVGKARAGKDTAASHLRLEHGFARLAFADPLKRAAREMFGLSHGQTWGDDLKEVVIPLWNMTPRRMFQLLGTEASKPFFGEDIWIKRLAMHHEAIKDTDDVVITDCRFDSEADWVRANGGVIVEIRRGTTLQGEAAAHISEAGLRLPPDYIIDNTGTLEELYARIDMLVAVLDGASAC